MAGRVRIMSGLAPLGSNACRRLEFVLGMLTGQQIVEMGTRKFRGQMGGVVSAGLHLRHASAPIAVLGGGRVLFRCLSELWAAGAFAGPPALIGQVYVTGDIVLAPRMDLRPDEVSFE